MFEMASRFQPYLCFDFRWTSSDHLHQGDQPERKREWRPSRDGGADMDKGRTFLDDRSVAADGLAPEIEEYSVVDDCIIDIIGCQLNKAPCNALI